MDKTRVKRPWQLAGLPKETPVLLAYSGGTDSTALLHLLLQFAREDGFSLTLAHVNHGIRGVDAIRDRDFCVKTANRFGLEICVLDADVPMLAKEHGRGIEEEAREVRYAFFEKIMREKKIPILVTAHHADDNLETVLFRLSRGTGLKGLGGIAPRREFADGVLVRPLLGIAKKELLLYCKENDLPFVTDDTNTDTQYARNRLRRDVIPVLEDLFSGASERVSEQSELLREDEDYLSSVAESVIDGQPDGRILPIKELEGLHPAIARRVIGTFLRRSTGTDALTATVDDVLKRLKEPKNRWRMTVANRATLSLQDGSLRVFFQEEKQEQNRCLPFEIGSFSIGEITISVLEWENTEKKCPNTATEVILNTDAEKNYHWRTVLPGDRMVLHGMHKRIVQVWREAGIPAEVRSSIPILCEENEIVFAPFVGVKKTAGQQKRKICVRFPARFLPTEKHGCNY